MERRSGTLTAGEDGTGTGDDGGEPEIVFLGFRPNVWNIICVHGSVSIDETSSTKVNFIWFACTLSEPLSVCNWYITFPSLFNTVPGIHFHWFLRYRLTMTLSPGSYDRFLTPCLELNCCSIFSALAEMVSVDGSVTGTSKDSLVRSLRPRNSSAGDLLSQT